MPLIQNFDFSNGRPKYKKSKSQNGESLLKSKSEKSLNEKKRLKLPTRNEWLIIRESLKFFRKNSADENLIKRTFNMTPEQFFVESHSIFDKIFWQLELSKDELKIAPDATQIEIANRIHWEMKPTSSFEKPQSNYKKEPTLIEKLRSMSKSERKAYWENNSK